MNPYEITDGIYQLDREWSARERKILSDCLGLLEDRGFTYLAIPSSVRRSSYRAQDIREKADGGPIMGQRIGETDHALGGSAEQGILDCFRGKEVFPQLIAAENQCFRAEPSYEGLRRVREFKKVEQYCFADPAAGEEPFEFLLQNALDFLDRLGLTDRRVVDMSETDPGYHTKKFDIEVRTAAYGWLETHSCSAFADEQTRRYEIRAPAGGELHTFSNTGIASPRILVPLMERAGIRID